MELILVRCCLKVALLRHEKRCMWRDGFYSIHFEPCRIAKLFVKSCGFGISQTSQMPPKKGQKQQGKKERSNLKRKNDNVFFFRLVLSRFFSLG